MANFLSLLQIQKSMNFIEELRWRGMIHDMMPGTEELLSKEMVVGYIGFDPTADSLHIGSLVQIMLLKHLQLAGHKPLALVGGATGMIGDPSGKSEERKLLTEDVLQKFLNGQKKQLEKFLDFDCGKNAAEIVNNYDWFKNIRLLDFLRETGKHITVSYMLSKDSVQNRLENGISFTEFSYQLIQGYDFYYLYSNHNCKLQLGGSDQWGNIVSGTELIRRMAGGEAFAVTTPLVTKADGGKFGKTESGTVWLDPDKTSPYQFYQFWLNVSDDDASKYLRIFTLLDKKTIEKLEVDHAEAPHVRVMQKALAREVTCMVHSEQDFETAVESSGILFGQGTRESLANLSEGDFLSVFDGVPSFDIDASDLSAGVNIIDLLVDKTKVLLSRGEARKLIQGGGISVNKEKVEQESFVVDSQSLINSKYIIIQKGKKNYYLIVAQ